METVVNRRRKPWSVPYYCGFYQGKIRPHDSCKLMPYFVTIRALNTADLADIETFLRADPFFVRMESKESETQPDGRPRVVFKMMIVPR